MAEPVNIVRKIYGKNTFTNVVDVSFSQLVPKDGDTADTERSPTLETFFSDYESLFYDIPPSGSENSHLSLVEKSADYLGLNLEDLREEIANLREENVVLKSQILILTNTSK